MLETNAALLVMQSGEQIEYFTKQKLTRRWVHPGDDSAWRNDQLILDGKTLADVALILEETYQRKPVFEDATMAQIQLSGTYPLGNMDRLLKALAVTAQ